jgi:hypothetical protein
MAVQGATERTREARFGGLCEADRAGGALLAAAGVRFVVQQGADGGISE